MLSTKEERSNKKVRMRVVMHFRQLLCLRRLRGMASTPVLAVLVEMKKKHVQRNEFSQFVMSSGNGILSVSDQSCGVYSTVEYKKGKTYGFSRSVTGPNWMCGITLNAKT